MRIKPLPPDALAPEIRYVHDEIANLIGRSQSPVRMIDAQGALLGPFTAMLNYPQFGVAALSFLRTLDTNATLGKTVREVAILTVAGSFGARFILYAHEIMGEVFGISTAIISTLTAGGHPAALNESEDIAHVIASSLVNGLVVPDSTYKYAVRVLGQDAVAELFFLVAGYTLIAIILNGFDISAPGKEE